MGGDLSECLGHKEKQNRTLHGTVASVWLRVVITLWLARPTGKSVCESAADSWQLEQIPESYQGKPELRQTLQVPAEESQQAPAQSGELFRGLPSPNAMTALYSFVFPWQVIETHVSSLACTRGVILGKCNYFPIC